MNIEDIKVGETYNVRVTVEGKSDKAWIQVRTGERGHTTILAAREAEAFSPISPENGTKNTEPAPKYDPCRLLRKGDKVQVKKRNGRCNGKAGEYLREAFCTVAEDETQNELVRVLHNATEYRLDPAYLELVTPVEELEPYYLTESSDFWGVDKADLEVEAAVFWKKTHPNAAAAAEAERDRLNAEYRKEQK